MDELDAGLRISLCGSAAEQALADFQRQIREWNIAMPHVTPLVLDFGLGDFERFGLIEYWIANEVGAGYCGKFLYVHDGQTCPLHHHREKMETFFILKGRVRMTFEETSREMNEGETLPVPQCKMHSFTGIGPALLLEISKPCRVDDNYFHDRRIPIGGNHEPSA